MTNYKIMIVGDAWGDKEAEVGLPFVGSGGRLLKSLLNMAGIKYSDCYTTNVFNRQPPGGNKVENFCGPKAEGIPGRSAVFTSKYVRAEYAGELERLDEEVRVVNPNIILALGAVPLWALCGTTGIKKHRGYPTTTKTGKKIIATYHPSAVIREWKLRPVIISDLEKAARESDYPELRRPERQIWIEPSIEDLLNFECKYLRNAEYISSDIETKQGQITCISFAPTPDVGLVVPFIDWEQTDRSYWRTKQDELFAWKWVRKVLSLPVTYVGQNFLYDMNYLWKQYGITVPSFNEDTMLLHHALQPEMEKGLNFLGSIYTDEASWKFMRSQDKTTKKED